MKVQFDVDYNMLFLSILGIMVILAYAVIKMSVINSFIFGFLVLLTFHFSHTFILEKPKWANLTSLALQGGVAVEKPL